MKQKKSVNGWNIFSVVVLVLLVCTEAFAVFQIWKLNMLPTHFLLILLAVVVLITVLIGLMLRPAKIGKWQKKVGHTKQIIAYILSLIIIIGCLAGSYVISKLNSTIASITSSSTINVLLDVYVLSDDPAQYIQDAADYIFGIADTTEAEDAQKAIAELESVLNCKITTQSYPTAFSMIDGLYAGEVNAIILDSSYLSIMDTLEGYSDFTSRTRLLHEHVIEKEIVKADNSSGSSGILLAPEVKDPTSSSFLLYISGNDARMALLADGGSDVNILVAVNPKAHQILMVNTPRDYYVENPAGNGARDKLSHCGLNGIDNCIGAMTNLYGLPINYYARINFSGFRTLIDAIGGVTVYSDIGFTAGDYYIYQGENHLNGAQALAFARERKNLAGGDNDRGKNQMRLIEGMIKQLTSGSLLTNYGGIMESLEGMFSTNIPAENIGKLVQMQLAEMPSWEIFTFAVTGDNGNDTCWAVGGGYGYVMYPHEDEVAHASALIGKVLAGETLTQDDIPMK